MSEWIHDSSFTMVKNPFWPGSAEIPQAKIDEVQFVMLDESAAFAEYEAGNLEQLSRTDIDRVKATRSSLRNW
jgi:oligopeptide transport system substrate-binding protein